MKKDTNWRTAKEERKDDAIMYVFGGSKADTYIKHKTMIKRRKRNKKK